MKYKTSIYYVNPFCGMKFVNKNFDSQILMIDSFTTVEVKIISNLI